MQVALLILLLFFIAILVVPKFVGMVLAHLVVVRPVMEIAIVV
jgi:hypothetical protein